MRSPKRPYLPVLTLGFAAVAAASLAVAAPSGAVAAALTHAGPATHANTPATPIYLNRAYSPAERAADLVSRMTTAEKAAQRTAARRPQSRASASRRGAGGTRPITA